MAIKDFDFLSPGVQIREVDKSSLEPASEDPGLVIIGRARRGPGMVPVKVRNKESLQDIFGAPNPNIVEGGDVWRSDAINGSTYGLYAAKAWLSSDTPSPVTFIRLLGHDTPSGDRSATYTKAGWNLGGPAVSNAVVSNASAYGLFLAPSASEATNVTGTLAAIFYVTGAAVTLSGTMLGHVRDANYSTTSSAGIFILSDNTTAGNFTLDVWSDQTTVANSFTINLDQYECHQNLHLKYMGVLCQIYYYVNTHFLPINLHYFVKCHLLKHTICHCPYLNKHQLHFLLC